MRAGRDPARCSTRCSPAARSACTPARPSASQRWLRRGRRRVRAAPRRCMVADTREQVAALNAAVRDRLVAAGHVDDQHAPSTTAGAADRCRRPGRDPPQRPRPGRRQPRHLDRHRASHRTARLTVAGRARRADAARPATCASTSSWPTPAPCTARKATPPPTAHLVIGEHTSAAVGLRRHDPRPRGQHRAPGRRHRRGRARAVGRGLRPRPGRPRPGPRRQARRREAARYAQLRPLEEVLDELRRAWTLEADAQTRLELPGVDVICSATSWPSREQRDAVVPTLKHAYEQARRAPTTARRRVRQLEPVVSAHAAEHSRPRSSPTWDDQRQPARDAADTVRARPGPNRAAPRRRAPGPRAPPPMVAELAALPAHHADTTSTGSSPSPSGSTTHPATTPHFDAHARAAAEQAQPDYLSARQAARSAEEEKRAAWRQLRQTEVHYSIALQHYGTLGHVDNPADRSAHVERASPPMRPRSRPRETESSPCAPNPPCAPNQPDYRPRSDPMGSGPRAARGLAAHPDRCQPRHPPRNRMGQSWTGCRARKSGARPQPRHQPLTRARSHTCQHRSTTINTNRHTVANSLREFPTRCRVRPLAHRLSSVRARYDSASTTPSVADPPCTTRTIRAVHDGTLLHLLERNRPHQERPP